VSVNANKAILKTETIFVNLVIIHVNFAKLTLITVQ